jgi:hypothetical protein
MMQALLSADGAILKAFVAAYEAFTREVNLPPDKRTMVHLPPEKKRLENYRVEVRESNQHYIVDFHPKRVPGDEGKLGADTTLGRALRFYVRKQDYEVVDVRPWR